MHLGTAPNAILQLAAFALPLKLHSGKDFNLTFPIGCLCFDSANWSFHGECFYNPCRPVTRLQQIGVFMVNASIIHAGQSRAFRRQVRVLTPNVRQA